MKIRPVRDEMFHADRRTGGPTDRYVATNSRFSQFCEMRLKKTQHTTYFLALVGLKCGIKTNITDHLQTDAAKVP